MLDKLITRKDTMNRKRECNKDLEQIGEREAD